MGRCLGVLSDRICKVTFNYTFQMMGDSSGETYVSKYYNICYNIEITYDIIIISLFLLFLILIISHYCIIMSLYHITTVYYPWFVWLCQPGHPHRLPKRILLRTALHFSVNSSLGSCEGVLADGSCHQPPRSCQSFRSDRNCQITISKIKYNI